MSSKPSETQSLPYLSCTMCGTRHSGLCNRPWPVRRNPEPRTRYGTFRAVLLAQREAQPQREVVHEEFQAMTTAYFAAPSVVSPTILASITSAIPMDLKPAGVPDADRSPKPLFGGAKATKLKSGGSGRGTSRGRRSGDDPGNVSNDLFSHHAEWGSLGNSD